MCKKKNKKIYIYLQEIAKTSYLIYKCKEKLQANPRKTLGLSLVFLLKCPLLGSKMQSHVIIMPIDDINAIKQ